jgi:ferrochelatase
VALDALLLLTFGGPEGPDEVMPFLDNVLRGRPVTPDRVEQVAAQYLEMGGRSPINDQSRRLLEALRSRSELPVYWGNRNWKPYVADAVGQMAGDGVRRAAAFVPSAYASYSGCRQYIEDIQNARRQVGPAAPELLKIAPFYEHPGFIDPLADGLRKARVDAGHEAPILMSAHSIPAPAAAGSDYEPQLRRAARLVAAGAGEAEDGWVLVFQSRSGPPGRPWLGPDVNDAIAGLPDNSDGSVIVVPLGFTSDHMEVVYDLDRKAAATAADRGLRLIRSATPGDDPRFVDMILELAGRTDDGTLPTCRPGCCPALSR